MGGGACAHDGGVLGLSCVQVDMGSGAERLVITAEDSHRKDRRYSYKASHTTRVWGHLTRV